MLLGWQCCSCCLSAMMLMGGGGVWMTAWWSWCSYSCVVVGANSRSDYVAMAKRKPLPLCLVPLDAGSKKMTPKRSFQSTKLDCIFYYDQENEDDHNITPHWSNNVFTSLDSLKLDKYKILMCKWLIVNVLRDNQLYHLWVWVWVWTSRSRTRSRLHLQLYMNIQLMLNRAKTKIMVSYWRKSISFRSVKLEVWLLPFSSSDVEQTHHNIWPSRPSK